MLAIAQSDSGARDTSITGRQAVPTLRFTAPCMIERAPGLLCVPWPAAGRPNLTLGAVVEHMLALPELAWNER
jgi:hypothetical protein